MSEAKAGREIKLEFTSLCCNRLVIWAGKSSVGSRGLAWDCQGKTLERGSAEQQQKTPLQHLAPQSRTWRMAEQSELVLEAPSFVVVNVSPADTMDAVAEERVCA